MPSGSCGREEKTKKLAISSRWHFIVATTFERFAYCSSLNNLFKGKNKAKGNADYYEFKALLRVSL